MIIRFSDIGENFPVSSKVRAKYQEYYSHIYDFVAKNYVDNRRFKLSIVTVLNVMLYCISVDNDIPYDWDIKNDPISNMPDVADGDLKRYLKELYLDVEDIDWNIERSYHSATASLGASVANGVNIGRTRHKTSLIDSRPTVKYKNITPKEDLFITFPKYPRISAPSANIPQIYTSLPEIPLRQRDVSCTTQPDKMSETELLSLFPNNVIRTRSEVMYQKFEGITLDPDYGLLIPVEGYTEAQIRDSIIRYPHIFKLKRNVDGELRNFYSEVEIDGELFSILDIWEYLVESMRVPLNDLPTDVQIEFVKEYAIRRYLLERDISGIEHKYPIHGALDEFITLFMPASRYEQEGFDPTEVARSCVNNRREYIYSRNPRVNSISDVLPDCAFGAYCTSNVCDRSCPIWAQFSYLLNRNNLDPSNLVFQLRENVLAKYIDVYDKFSGSTVSVVTNKDTNFVANIFSYIGICNLWEGSVLKCVTYNLRLSRYIEMIQSSWGYSGQSDELEYMTIWAREAKVLVISGIDYINFKDFQAQTLLQLLQDREENKLTTFIVTPRFDNLSGQGKLFDLMMTKLKRTSIQMN